MMYGYLHSTLSQLALMVVSGTVRCACVCGDRAQLCSRGFCSAYPRVSWGARFRRMML